jgi:hypothetical protein
MLEVHGVLPMLCLEVGKDVAYQYVEVSKFIPIHNQKSSELDVNPQIFEDTLELIKSRSITLYNNVKTFQNKQCSHDQLRGLA